MSAPLSTLTNAPTTESDTAVLQEHAAKRSKSSPSSSTVLTYQLLAGAGRAGAGMSFQLRPKDTLYDLCDLICNEWMKYFRGHDWGVDEHCWFFTDSATGKRYESPNGIPDEDCGFPPTHQASREWARTRFRTGVGIRLRNYD